MKNMLRTLLIVSVLMLSLWVMTVTGQPEFDYGSDFEGSGSYECDISDPYYGTACDDSDWVWDWWDDDRGDGDPDTFDFYSDYYPDDYW